MPADELPSIVISISDNAKAQLAAMPPPEYDFLGPVAPRIVAQIGRHIGLWTPRSERGGSGIIKWCEAISLHCNADIYRLKSVEEMEQWRVFFFLLDLDTPPTRHVEDIVEWQSNKQCYDEMTQPHVVRLQKATARFKVANRLRLMR